MYHENPSILTKLLGGKASLITTAALAVFLLSTTALASSVSDSPVAFFCGEWPNITDCDKKFNTENGTGNVSDATLPVDNLLEMDLDYIADGDNWPLERIVSMIVPVFFGIIGFAGLVGNALVILVVVANQQMRSTTNLLIINLALSDILFVIFACHSQRPEWPSGNMWCKFVQYMIAVTCDCSVYSLVLMSYDRFLAVVHLVTSMSLRLEPNAMMIAILFAWILIVTTAIPVALAHAVRVYQFRGHNYTACVFSTEEERWSLVAFQALDLH